MNDVMGGGMEEPADVSMAGGHAEVPLQGGAALRGGAWSTQTWLWILIGVLIAAVVGVGIWLTVYLVDKNKTESNALRVARIKQNSKALRDRLKQQPKKTAVPKRAPPKTAAQQISASGNKRVTNTKVPSQQPAQVPSRMSVMHHSTQASKPSDDIARSLSQKPVPVGIKGPGGLQLAAGKSGYAAPRHEGLAKEIAEREKKLGMPSASAVMSGKYDRNTLRNLKAIHRMGGSMMPIRTEQDHVAQAGGVGAVEHARAVARYLAKSGRKLTAQDGELLEANPRLTAHLEEGRASMDHRDRLLSLMRATVSTTHADSAAKTMANMLRAKDEMLQRGMRIPEFTGEQKKALVHWYHGGATSHEAADLAERVLDTFNVVV